MKNTDLISVVEHAVADIKCLKAYDQLENTFVISAIEECMSSLMLKEWAERIANSSDRHSSMTKLSRLLEFLQYWRSMHEYNNAPIRNLDKLPSTCDSARKCLVHQDADHPVWRCRVFKAMTANERYEVVKSNNACILCLEKGHRSANCTVPFRCSAPNCNSAHNVLLHVSLGGGSVSSRNVVSD